MASKKDHSTLTPAEENYIKVKSAYDQGKATAAQYNAAVDAVLHPGYPSRANTASAIANGNKSVVQGLADDAKQSPVVKDIVKGIDTAVGTNLSDKLKNSSKSATKAGASGYGYSYGSGSGSGSVAGTAVNTGSSYLDQLHAEQERVWQREDTAYQRTVRDLQAAGLNPVLAVNGGVNPVGGSSSSSDSQVVGAVAELAGMAISGLTETATGIAKMYSLDKTVSANSNGNFLSKFSNWYKNNSSTVRNVVSTASSLVRLFK